MKKRRAAAALCILMLAVPLLSEGCGSRRSPESAPPAPTCADSSAGSAAAFQEYLKQINANHLAVGKLLPQGNITKYEYRLPENDVGFTEKELESLVDYKKTAQPVDYVFLSSAQAKADAKLFFRVLKYCYGPYQYFGGDGTFGKAETAVLSQLPKGNVSTRALCDILVRNLGFVQDVHVLIGDKRTADFSLYYHSETVEYEKDAGGYYKIADGKKSYVATVNGKDPAGFMKLSISPSGKLVYYVGALYWASKLTENPSASVRYRSGEAEDSLVLSPVLASAVNQEEGFRQTELGGVPTVSIRRFHDISQYDNACEAFAASGSALKGKKALILDLRGNGGGSDEYAMNWIENFTSRKMNSMADISSVGFDMIGQESRAGAYFYCAVMRSSPKLSEDAKEEADRVLERYRNGKNEWRIDKCRPAGLTDNDSLIFVLIDNGNASSGEAAPVFLSKLKNVVLVGTNTAGCMMGNTEVQFVLPNSKLQVSCSNWLQLYNPAVLTEGEGLKPDIWDTCGTTERLLAMLRYYRLADSVK